MFVTLAIILAIAWLFGFVVFHVASWAIHLLLIFAVISFVMSFFRGRGTTAP